MLWNRDSQFGMCQQFLNTLLANYGKTITLGQEVGSENVKLITLLAIGHRHSELRRAGHVITVQQLAEGTLITAENISGITDKDIFFCLRIFITGNHLTAIANRLYFLL